MTVRGGSGPAMACRSFSLSHVADAPRYNFDCVTRSADTVTFSTA